MDIGHGESRLGATIGFGSYNLHRLALQPRAAADMLPIMRACVTMPSRARHPVVDGGSSHPTIYRGKRPATMASARVAGRQRGSENRSIVAGSAGGTLRLADIIYLECLEWPRCWRISMPRGARLKRGDSLAFGVIEGDGARSSDGQADQVSVRLRGRPGDCRVRLCRHHDLVFRSGSAGLSAARALRAADHDPGARRRRPTAGRVRDRAARLRADRRRSPSG